MKRKRTTRTIELSMERSDFFVASKCKPSFFRCVHCGRQASFVIPAEAARLSGQSLREIYRRIESAEIHFFETPDGALLVCLDSLLPSS